MANVIVFPVERAKRQSRSHEFTDAEVVIFTGVQVERRDFQKGAPKAKPRRSRRQQAVKLQED